MLPTDRLLPDAHLQVVDTILAPDQITLVLTATAPTAPCPVCRQLASRVQSCYTRTLADLPVWCGIAVRECFGR